MPRTATVPRFANFAEVMVRLEGISPERICVDPPPGKATEKDVLRFLHAHGRHVYELVDGVLVEKVMGILESYVALALVRKVGIFLDRHDLGFLVGEGGPFRLMPDLIRIPDVSFVAWTQLPTREIPITPIPDLAPALAVEVLSEGNTPKEMERKLRDYFFAGVQLVWFVDPVKRTVTVYSAPDEATVLTESDTLDGGAVLPGFSLPVSQLFAGLPQAQGSSRKKPRNGTSPSRRK